MSAIVGAGQHPARPWALVLAGAALCFLAAGAPALAAPALPDSPGGNALRLNAALARIARDPRDVPALLDAGDAALATGDVEAAIGFFQRANQLLPRNARVLAGLAGATLQNDDPVGAIALFDQADRAGARSAAVMADRGLAYDLIGDNLRAQLLYREALAQGDDIETARRLALSQAISGDMTAAEATLRPLLQAQDRAGWRTRAFIFAIAGQTEEAVTVAKTLLPPALATQITPYLRYMPHLTRAQKAAAANLGVFPRAADIGRDDPRIAAYLASGRKIVPGMAGRAAAPAGEPLGSGGASREPRVLSRSERAAARAARTAPPDPLPVREVEEEPAPAPAPKPKIVLTLPQTAYGPIDVGAPAAAVTSPTAPAPAPVPVPVSTVRALPARAAAMPVVLPVRTLPTAAAPKRAINLSDAFSDLGKPATAIAARAGTVDITRLAAARTKAAKPPPPSHPSRIWVQLAAGRDRDALATDWKRFARDAGAALRGRKPSVSEWGARNRLLAGPFESAAEAQKFVQQLAKAGVSGPFQWVSPAGQVVDSLDER